MKKIISIFMSCLLLFNFMSQVSADPVNDIAKENRPKVSIIVPVYKVEPWLRECMDSLVNQTLKEIEIICVDDGSPDNCGKILDEYAGKDNRVKVIHQVNSGVQKARNAGLDIAKGEYITFVDSDDYIEKNAYEIAYKYAKEDDVDILNFNYRTFNNGKDNHINNLDLSDSQTLSIESYIQKIFKNYVWDNIYKSEIIQNSNIRFVPGIKPSDDTCFLYMAFGKAKTVKSIPAKFYNYRLRSDSICDSIGGDKNIFINSYKMFKHICDFWRNNDCLKNNEQDLITLIVRWAKLYHRTAVKYAREVLDSFGNDVYNPETVKKCPKYIQKELKSLERAARRNKR